MVLKGAGKANKVKGSLFEERHLSKAGITLQVFGDKELWAVLGDDDPHSNDIRKFLGSVQMGMGNNKNRRTIWFSDDDFPKIAEAASLIIDEHEDLPVGEGFRSTCKRLPLVWNKGDCVFHADATSALNTGQVYIAKENREYVRCAAGSTANLFVFEDYDRLRPLSHALFKVTFVDEDEDTEEITVYPAKTMKQQIKNTCFLDAIALGQTFKVVDKNGEWLVEVLDVRDETQGGEDEDEDTHFFRGVITSSTEIFIQSEYFEDTGKFPEKGTPDAVKVNCNDDEHFYVRRNLLRPCIALTKVVRGSDSEVDVDVGCLLFDRIIIFLQKLEKGKQRSFDLDINLTEDLLHAAEHLGCAQLKNLCLEKMGEFESRIRNWRWEDVERENKEHGKCLIVVDGMVLDVTQWLNEHPGGDTIIPAQSLGVDSTYWFEIYHASRESFVYLKMFYVGEVVQEDLAKIPSVPGGEAASEDFRRQLTDYTTWRFDTQAAHL
eukprot:Clim_evm7s23 gene=Clim_evmTU7s23